MNNYVLELQIRDYMPRSIAIWPWVVRESGLTECHFRRTNMQWTQICPHHRRYTNILPRSIAIWPWGVQESGLTECHFRRTNMQWTQICPHHRRYTNILPRSAAFRCICTFSGETICNEHNKYVPKYQWGGRPPSAPHEIRRWFEGHKYAPHHQAGTPLYPNPNSKP